MVAVAVKSGGASKVTANGIAVQQYLTSLNTTAKYLKAQAALATGGADANSSNGAFQVPGANEPVDNNPFDPRSRRISPTRAAQKGSAGTVAGAVGGGVLGSPGGSVANGVIYTLPQGLSGVGGQQEASGLLAQQAGGKALPQFSCFFRYNPTEIDTTYGFDYNNTANLNPSYLNATAAGLGSTGTLLNQTYNFSLLFDRTYELWCGSNSPYYGAMGKWGGGPFKYGVQWDVWACERLLGVYGQWTGQGPSGPPAASPVQVAFSGGVDIGQGIYSNVDPSYAVVGAQAFAFQGWCTGLSVAYTRFDINMMPTRCAVSLTFELIYALQSTTSAPNDNSGTSTTTPTTGG
jgi:hypothetical protein